MESSPDPYLHFSQDKDGYFAGGHLVVDFWGCKNLYNHVDDHFVIFWLAIKDTGARIIRNEFEKFEGGGSTGIFLLSESHASYHTYPEHEAVFFDMFTCGKCDPRKGFPRLEEYFKPTHVEKMFIRRGVINKNR